MIRIENMTCGYGKARILNGINLQIESGEITGIIGPNGSGKTTLLRAISKALRPMEGTVFFSGKDIWEIELSEIARSIAVVSQRFESGWMTVEEFVLMGRTPYFGKLQFIETGRDIEIARRYMELAGVYRLRDKLMEEISGGERQLALIARALTQEPRLLLLDEPTSHLDITHQVGILDLIKRLNAELSITVIMVLHDLNMASEYCSRLVLLNDGGIHRQGTPSEVLTYQVIEDVYKTVVVVEKNPISQKPFVVLVSGEDRVKR